MESRNATTPRLSRNAPARTRNQAALSSGVMTSANVGAGIESRTAFTRATAAGFELVNRSSTDHPALEAMRAPFVRVASAAVGVLPFGVAAGAEPKNSKTRFLNAGTASVISTR